MGIVEDIKAIVHRGEAVAYNVLRGFPSKGMKVIGVTGTDGKSTTCLMIAQMLRENGIKAGLITTVAVDYGDGEESSPTSQTTPSVGMLLDMFSKMRQNGVEWVVIETSSHALHQGRVWGVPYEIAVLTNVTHEHLDYHGTFEKYRDAKRRLFKQANVVKGGKKIGIINADDPSAELFSSDIKHPITYGIKNGDLRAHDVKLTSGGSRYKAVYNPRSMHGAAGQGGGEERNETYKRYGEASTAAANAAQLPKAQQTASSAGKQDEPVHEPRRELRIECHVPGRFNVYNSLAVAAVGGAIGLTKDQIEKGIRSLKSVPGRMERVQAGQDFEVIVDYAVTAEALRNVLTTVKDTTEGKVRLVFGATGDRDKSKRPDMGKVAAELADYIYLTDDETYTEDSQVIIDAVYEGIKTAGGEAKTQVITDRKEAITKALNEAEVGDTVLLTGIGHQKYRSMGGIKVDWDEREVATAIIKSLGK